MICNMTSGTTSQKIVIVALSFGNILSCLGEGHGNCPGAIISYLRQVQLNDILCTDMHTHFIYYIISILFYIIYINLNDNWDSTNNFFN